MTALRSIESDALKPLVPHPPSRDRPERWSAIAEQLEGASDELAGELLTFADVPERAGGLIDDVETARWAAAARTQRVFETTLATNGLIDEPLAQARALAGDLAQTAFRVLLIGVVELPLAARAALRVAAAVDAIIAAPESMADRFDSMGCIIPDHWCDAPIDIPEDRLIFADNPRDQAAHALSALAGAPITPCDAVIGVPHPEVAHHIQRLAARTGFLRVREAAGRPIAETPPAVLLRAIADHLDDHSVASLASLLRHPDLELHLLRTLPGVRGPEWWLTALDDFAAESFRTHLEVSTEGAKRSASARRTSLDVSAEIAAQLSSEVDRLLAPLAGSRRPASEWAAPLAALFHTIYEGVVGSRNSPRTSALIESCEHLAAGLADLASSPGFGDRFSAAQAIRLVLDSLGDGALPPRPDAEAIELLGWLELPFDPAKTVILTGMNEEYVSGGAGNDPLLPDSLRRALGISNADRRSARDAYLMTALMASRPRVAVIAGRRSGDDDPLRPSRVLLAAAPETLLCRVRRFFDDRTPVAAPRIEVRVAPGKNCGFPRRPRTAAPTPSRISVTAFRAYLASPYLFYLTHILGLEQREQPPQELDALAYGSLMHEVLHRFGESDASHATDAARILEFLDFAVADEARTRFGPQRPGAVDLQLQLLRMRLSSFASAQANWRSQGWVIEHLEWPKREHRPVVFDVDGAPIQLSGRIDRIDRHEDGRIAILDYKSGNQVDPPDKTHRSRSGWKDLQLPLYRHIAADAGLPEDLSRITFGYFAVPRDPKKTGILPASWSAADLASADDKAREIVRRIRAAEFDEVGVRAPDEWVFEVLTGLTYPDPMEEEGDAA